MKVGDLVLLSREWVHCMDKRMDVIATILEVEMSELPESLRVVEEVRLYHPDLAQETSWWNAEGVKVIATPHTCNNAQRVV